MLGFKYGFEPIHEEAAVYLPIKLPILLLSFYPIHEFIIFNEGHF
jgi:hypothetical protein